MSASNTPDPRLLLPEWLRDGEAPVALNVPTPEPATVPEPGSDAAIETTVVAPAVAQIPATPYSDRLSLDTRLDPGQLVAPSDLPRWLGGLESIAPAKEVHGVGSPTASLPVPAIEEPEPYEGVDAPQEGVVDVEVNGWILVAAALGLLVLLVAAIRLYLS